MNSNDWHNFHKNRTSTRWHSRRQGGPEIVGYKYLEKSNQDKDATVFIPTFINLDDYEILSKILDNVLTKEFDSYYI